MTLSEIIRLIEGLAQNQPSINMIVRNDIYRLNEKQDARYGVFAWLQGQHTTSINSSFITYNFTFFYADRLTSDLSNQIEVQSVGIQTLDNILRQLSERGVYVDSYSFQSFNERFNDACAGVMCRVALEVPLTSLCAESFADLAEPDFSDDFMIY